MTGPLLRITLLVLFAGYCGAPVASAQMLANSNATTEEIISAPDRPNASAIADVTQKGVLELEYGFSRQWFGAGSNANAFSSKFRFGMAENLDVSWSADDFVTRSGASRGFGDTVLSVRYRFARQSDLVPSMALAYRVKLPTAANREIGSGYADHQIAFLASKDIKRHHFDFNFIRTLCGSEAGFISSNGFSAAYSRRPVSPRVIGLVEFSGTVSPAHTVTGTAVLALRVTPRLVLDGGIDFGLTEAVPRKRLVLGMTYALGRLFPSGAGRRAAKSQGPPEVNAGL